MEKYIIIMSSTPQELVMQVNEFLNNYPEYIPLSGPVFLNNAFLQAVYKS